MVRVVKLPFRKAHKITGKLVKLAESKGCDLAELELNQMQSIEGAINQDVYNVLSVENSVASRTSEGGTSPTNVAKAAKAARKRFLM